MGLILAFAVTVLMTLLALIAIFSIPALKKWAGLGNVAPTGLAAKFNAAPAAQ